MERDQVKRLLLSEHLFPCLEPTLSRWANLRCNSNSESLPEGVATLPSGHSSSARSRLWPRPPETDSALELQAQCLQDNPSLSRSFPNSSISTGLSRSPGAEAAEIAEGLAPPPPRARHHRHPRRPPAGWSPPDPGPPSSFLSPRLPDAATVAGREIGQSAVPASSPSSPQIAYPSPSLRSPDRPFLPLPGVWRGAECRE